MIHYKDYLISPPGQLGVNDQINQAFNEVQQLQSGIKLKSVGERQLNPKILTPEQDLMKNLQQRMASINKIVDPNESKQEDDEEWGEGLQKRKKSKNKMPIAYRDILNTACDLADEGHISTARKMIDGIRSRIPTEMYLKAFDYIYQTS